jgi:hypothetical protein
MLTESIRGIDHKAFDKICIVSQNNHIDKYGFKQALINEISDTYNIDTEIVGIDSSRNQPHTVIQGLAAQSTPVEFAYIKDCDNFFKVSLPECCNFVTALNLNTIPLRVVANNKSYVQTDKFSNITNIAEKKIISSLFSVGGYGISDISSFIDSYGALEEYEESLYISHVIYHMLEIKRINFTCVECEDYVDWGTMTEWREFTSQFKTLFVDIDGILVENSGKLTQPTWGASEGLHENIQIINNEYKRGHTQIILTTSRPEDYKDITITQLRNAGLVHYDKLIMGLLHCKRILINDFSDTNPYPSAVALNIQRNKSIGEQLR